MQTKSMELIERSNMKETVPAFEIGDTVDVHVRILEGEKERVQIFNGVVIARSGADSARCSPSAGSFKAKGSSANSPYTRRESATSSSNAPGEIRRAKLYYLRLRSGKAVRLKERFAAGKATLAEAQAAKAEKRTVKIAAKAAKADAKAAAKAAKPE